MRELRKEPLGLLILLAIAVGCGSATLSPTIMAFGAPFATDFRSRAEMTEIRHVTQFQL